jgi:hypothetical protein
MNLLRGLWQIYLESPKSHEPLKAQFYWLVGLFAQYSGTTIDMTVDSNYEAQVLLARLILKAFKIPEAVS